MWSWFGGAAAQKRKDAPKNAILMLREQLDMLQKRERHLENQMEEQENVAKKNVTSNKTGTLFPLSGGGGKHKADYGIKRPPKLPYGGKRSTKRTSNRQRHRSPS